MFYFSYFFLCCTQTGISSSSNNNKKNFEVFPFIYLPLLQKQTSEKKKKENTKTAWEKSSIFISIPTKKVYRKLW